MNRSAPENRKRWNFRANRLMIAAALLLLSGSLAAIHAFRGKARLTESQSAGQSKPSPGEHERFDLVVRDDFFAGMFGDWERFERGMKRCEEMLAKNPQHAEAMVWHGGGLVWRAQRAYTQGEDARGDQLWEAGLQEMDQAVRLAPKHIGVKIARSALLIGIAQSGFNPSDTKNVNLIRNAVEDYEYVFRVQEPTFGELSEHSRCELIFGIAAGWSLLENEPKTLFYLQRANTLCKGSAYQAELKKLLSGNPILVRKHTCIGCH